MGLIYFAKFVFSLLCHFLQGYERGFVECMYQIEMDGVENMNQLEKQRNLMLHDHIAY